GATSLAFNLTGTMLVAGFGDGRIALWDDLEASQEPQPPDVFASGHAPVIETLAFVPSRNLVATGGPDGVIRLWHTRHEAVGKPFGDTSAIYDAAFSDDGTLLASTGVAGTLEWWDVARHSKLAERPLENHNVGVALAFISPTTVELLTRSGAFLRCTRESCVPIPRHSGTLPSAIASLGPQARFWFEWRERPYRCTPNGCGALPGPSLRGDQPGAISPDGLRWAVGGLDAGESPGGLISFCQASGCRPLDVGSGGSSTWIGAMKFDPSGSLLAVGLGDGRVLFFNGRTGVRLGPPITAHSGGVEHFAFRGDGAMMA
ncbi:MAG: WD40 repeat domain-containing protein, partial [Candidatus Dormibacteraceae bacterium]